MSGGERRPVWSSAAQLNDRNGTWSAGACENVETKNLVNFDYFLV